MSTLGQEMKRLREMRGLSLEEASSKAGITRQYLSMLEKGQRRSASFEIMTLLSDAYATPLDYLKLFINGQGVQLSEEEINLWNQLVTRMGNELFDQRNNEFIQEASLIIS